MTRNSGVLNAKVVRGTAFTISVVCVLVAAVAALLAIWEFSGTDAMWRTVASCAVIGGGALVLAFVNTVLGEPRGSD